MDYGNRVVRPADSTAAAGGDGGAERSQAHRCGFGFFALWMCATMAVGQAAYGQAATREQLNAVRITITPQGLRLSQDTVRPGTVHFIIVNHTLIQNPELQVVDPLVSGVPLVAKTSGVLPAVRVTQVVSLSAGKYVIRLGADPKVQAALAVQP